MEALVQADETGCGLACVAMLAGTSYPSVRTLAANLGISPAEEALWSDTTYVRRLLPHYGLHPYSETVATSLADGGWWVSVVNPARVKGFAQSQLTRNKNDHIDAKLLAVFAQRSVFWSSHSGHSLCRISQGMLNG